MEYVILLIALLLIGYSVVSILRYFRARNWVSTHAVITAFSEGATVRWLTYNMRVKYYFPLVKYEYQFNGKRYVSDRVSLDVKDIWVPEVDQWGNMTRDSEKLWNDWRVGTSIVAFVDPARPNRSVVVREMPRKRYSHYMATMLGGALILIVLAVVRVWSSKQYM